MKKIKDQIEPLPYDLNPSLITSRLLKLKRGRERERERADFRTSCLNPNNKLYMQIR